MKISMALQKSRIVFSFQHHFCFDKKKSRTSPDQKDRKQRPSADAKKKTRLLSPTTKALLPCKYLFSNLGLIPTINPWRIPGGEKPLEDP